MAAKLIFHYPLLELVDQTTINSVPVADMPIVVLAYYDGKHAQIRIQPFNAANASKESLPFAERLQYYKKVLRPSYEIVPFFVTEIGASPLISGVGSVDLSQTLPDFLAGLSIPVLTGYEGNFVGFFDGNSLILEEVAPSAAIDFNEGLTV